MALRNDFFFARCDPTKAAFIPETTVADKSDFAVAGDCFVEDFFIFDLDIVS